MVQQVLASLSLVLQGTLHFFCRTYRKPSYHLLTIKQGSQENLRSYVRRFNSESLRVDIPDEKLAITALIVGLSIQSKDLMFSISKNPQTSMAEVLTKAEKYINGEEALMSKWEALPCEKRKARMRKSVTEVSRDKETETDPHKAVREDKDRSLKRRGNVRDRLGPPQLKLQPRYPPQQFTPLMASVSQVLYEVSHEKFLRWPSQMKTDPAKRDMTKY